MRYSILLLLISCSISAAHPAATSATTVKPVHGLAPSDAELKRFGQRCYELPWVLWVKVLDFLIGEEHGVYYTIDTSITHLWSQKHTVALGDNGRIIFHHQSNIYGWYPHGRHPVQKTWSAHSIPKGWWFERCENGCIVLVNNERTLIKTLDDETFKEQAEYKIRYSETYFYTNNKGKTLVCAPHPLITKSAMKQCTVVTCENETYAGTLQTIPMPAQGVMPPLILDKTGKYLAAHATETDQVYVFDVPSKKLLTTLTLSAHTLNEHVDPDGEQRHSVALWRLRNPETQRLQFHAFTMRQAMISTSIEDVAEQPHSIPMHFYQENKNVCFGLFFTHPQAGSKIPELISCLKDKAPHKEAAAPEADAKYYTATTYWNIETGKPSLEETYPLNHYSAESSCALSESGMLLSRPGMSDIFISPAGNWALSNAHKKVADKTYKAKPSRMDYFGGKKMRSKIDGPPAYRTFMMRLYTLQRASQLKEHVRPPTAIFK